MLSIFSIIPIGNVAPIRVKVHQVYSEVLVEQIPLILHWRIVLAFRICIGVVVGDRVVVQLHKVECDSVTDSWVGKVYVKF